MRGTKNRNAFKAYVQGESQFSVISKADMAKARKNFEKATKLDRKFARAWGWRSYAPMRSIMVGWLPEAEARNAGDWAKKAVALDPNDYATYWDLAFYQLNVGQFDKAIKTYEKALKLYLRPGTEELHQYRISSIFESHPEVDHIVIGLIHRGVETVADLHGCEVGRVFDGVEAPLDQRRWFLERLKAHLRLIDGFVIDKEDAAYVDGVRSLGIEVLAAPTIMRSVEDRTALAQAVLDFAASIRAKREAEVE